ncbi:dihydroxy-acid dehydratase [Rhinocladiella mackenziei CBS 650.93]|uniref:Rhinocladiella mackenziei CBS 650.93 unplaced genomic scaffold supercont1.1, whole genome shotgun sequence n=1 Tax=Rhinocladiella mackenziei CBS 650.93 TaxID=1442369 RepID=A0A0D2IX47_9EURO|nr:dihydroxy-acid dehydratase [Rhinocladiella mackenziei CBS 650.93]KIX10574.1 dihydroxy-acid dehydratase [Rhinocladiella mackenziei CBS 650.93]
MSCTKESSSCNSCLSHGHQNDGVGDIEDYKVELESLRQRTRELEQKLSEAGLGNKTNGVLSKLRSANWFSDKTNPEMCALYTDRYLNYGLTQEELMSGKPIVGIAQSGSDLAPCNRYHLELAKRVREGIRTAGGVAFEFPTHPIQESSRRPTATLDRNLAYIGLVELLHAYPLDGVVLLTGCDKTTPAFLMAAATVNIPAICLNVGPMLNGRLGSNDMIGSGTVLWKARDLHAAGEIDTDTLVEMIAAGTPSAGHCNTMGTASTMNALAEALGMALPGSAAIPAPYRERSQCAYKTGRQIVEMVHADRKPSDIMTREAFENAIVVNSAIGGSTNAPIHLNAVAKHIGVPLDLDDWDRIGFNIPLLVNVQPAGEMLCEEYYKAGGLQAVMAELLDQGKLHAQVLTCNGRTVSENVKGKHSWDRRTIKAYSDPMKKGAGFLHLTGNLFDSAIMKTSVISDEFRKDFLEDPNDPNAFECKAVVFDGREDFIKRIDDPQTPIDRRTILVMRGAGPLGYPGAAEVVNMHAPGHVLKQGVTSLPCIGDGRQSGTSGSPSILNASPEAAAGGNLALLRDGDKLRVDLDKRRVDILVTESELKKRREELESKGGYPIAESQTPWQDIFRRETGQLNEGMVLQNAVKYQRIAQRWPAPLHNH